MDITSLIIEAVSGAVGGNVAGAAMKEKRLGGVGNSIAGIVGGGLGGTILYPSATDPLLGSEKWGAGPTGLILKQTGGWTHGILANQIWSFAGEV